MKQDGLDRSRVMFPPPLLHLATFVAGLGLHFAFPQSFLPDTWMQLVTGLPFIVISFALVASAFRTMRRSGTDPNAYKPTTAIVVDGPFRFSRNPMYLSFTALYIGIAFAVDALWPFALLPIALVGISLGVIKREERYLEQKFGQEYLQYKDRVRRWI